MKLRPCLPFAVFANEAATDRASGSQPTGGHRDLPPGDLGGTTPSGDQTGRFRRPLLRLRRLPLCWPRGLVTGGIENGTQRRSRIERPDHRADIGCRRPIKMSPLCQFEMTLPADFPGGVWGDGSTDERWGVVAARGAAGFGSAALDGDGRGTAAGARAPTGISAVEGVSH